MAPIRALARRAPRARIAGATRSYQTSPPSLGGRISRTLPIMELPPIDLVICDCDGTLVDSHFAIVETFNRTLAEIGLPPADARRVGRYVGLPLETLLDDLLPELDSDGRERLQSTYRRLYPTVAAGRTPLFPGVRDGLERLTGRGLRLAIATGKSLAGVRRFLVEERLEATFEAVGCGDTAARPKPYPDMVDDVLAATGVAPERAVVVGDTPYDIKMGCAAGVATCAVTTGGFTAEELAVSRPTLLLSTFVELVALVSPHRVDGR